MDVARSIGLSGEGEVTGTIDETDVLLALAELADGSPEDADLCDDAATRVGRARSAGVEVRDGSSGILFPHGVSTIQLRYRSEMADIFTDLAIDVGLRRHRELVDTH